MRVSWPFLKDKRLPKALKSSLELITLVTFCSQIFSSIRSRLANKEELSTFPAWRTKMVKFILTIFTGKRTNTFHGPPTDKASSQMSISPDTWIPCSKKMASQMWRFALSIQVSLELSWVAICTREKNARSTSLMSFAAGSIASWWKVQNRALKHPFTAASSISTNLNLGVTTLTAKSKRRICQHHQKMTRILTKRWMKSQKKHGLNKLRDFGPYLKRWSKIMCDGKELIYLKKFNH